MTYLDSGGRNEPGITGTIESLTDRAVSMDSEIGSIKTNVAIILAQEGLEIDKIILFGSRATGNARTDSDYDLLIVVHQSLPVQAKIELSTKIRKTLAELLIDADVIIKSGEELEQHRKEIGTVTRQALQEGVAL